MDGSRGRGGRRIGRGQSEVIGVVLVLSLTVIGATAVAATGAAVLADSQSNSQVSQAENAMSQMSSKASLVALGESEGQSFDLGRLDDGSVEVREDAGQVTLRLDGEEIYSEQYGAVVATIGGSEVAYQGGGVWKKEGDRSVMVSPPEYHYQQRTLTFPIVRVNGTDHATGAVQGQLSKGDSRPIYPNSTENRANPLEDGNLTVELQSDYYRGWHDFFDERTEGTVEIDHENRTVTAELAVPFEKNIENAVTVRETIIAKEGNKPTPHQEGVDYPSASPVIEDKIERCENGENECVAIDGNETIDHTEDSAGTYYASGKEIPDALTVKTGGQDIDIIIDGSFEPNDITIEGDGTVSMYIKGEFNLSGNNAINEGGDPSQLFVYLHSDISASQQGTPSFTGVIYAPNTDFTLSGNTDFEGALIANSLRIDGNAGTFEYDESLSEIEIEITSSPDAITYLHVTDNEIEVELR
ncbi:type IV pilin [Halalkalicoccus sp. NIPERK01]|uniref:DUF7289 family protein n=1 Tax=Halalkalicoccus sp. NIPERK01 TaxID=3053469 RepID=UPI00256F3768|nr:type IV pilin [Halalkalicoccus sp. NIPERK01]MDL5360453.1 type IV pilin [Halalkalicoccus sp. NIPERK01]